MHEQIAIKVENNSDQLKAVEVWNDDYSDPDIVISFLTRNKKDTTVRKIERRVQYTMLNILSKTAIARSDYESIAAQLDFHVITVVPDVETVWLPINFKHDPDQHQSAHIANDVKFQLEKYSKLTFNIPAKTTLLFDLFSIIVKPAEQETSNE
jgi:hypothetical protein